MSGGVATVTTHVYATLVGSTASSSQPIASVSLPVGAMSTNSSEMNFVGSIQVSNANDTALSIANQMNPGLVQSAVIDVTFVIDGLVCIASHCLLMYRSVALTAMLLRVHTHTQESGLPTTITICFATTDLSTANKCLGYIDPASNVWTCEDRSLTVVNNQLCGVTPHLTNFAILLDGGNANGNGRTYMLGSFTKDIQLILPLTGGFLVLLIVFVLFLMYTRWGNYLLYGSRAEAKRASRRHRERLGRTGKDNGETDMAL